MPVKIVKKRPVHMPIASVELLSDAFGDRGVRLDSRPTDMEYPFRLTLVHRAGDQLPTINVRAASVREFAKALLEMVGD